MTSSVFFLSREQRFYNVQVVLDKLHAGLSVNMKKTHRTSLTIRGHIVSASGIQVGPDKLEIVHDIPIHSHNNKQQSCHHYTLYYTDYNTSFVFLTVNNHKHPIIQSLFATSSYTKTKPYSSYTKPTKCSAGDAVSWSQKEENAIHQYFFGIKSVVLWFLWMQRIKSCGYVCFPGEVCGDVCWSSVSKKSHTSSFPPT